MRTSLCSEANPPHKSRQFAERVYEVVRRIPAGRVTTYGRIAQAIGEPRSARIVGWSLKWQAASGLPCHRVVNRDGELTGAWHFGHPMVMRGLLEDEGVLFTPDGRVDLSQCFWDPSDQDDTATDAVEAARSQT